MKRITIESPKQISFGSSLLLCDWFGKHKFLVAALLVTQCVFVGFLIHASSLPHTAYAYYRWPYNDTMHDLEGVNNGTQTDRRSSDPSHLPVLFVAILSSHSRRERRDAIRNSWLKECTTGKRAVCKFITDGLGTKNQPVNQSVISLIEEESRMNGDIAIVNSPTGINFAIRLVRAMEYADQYTGDTGTGFDYFLRIDDDQFLCIDRLLQELPHRPRENVYWGVQHCDEGLKYIDEGWLVLSADLVRYFLDHKDTLPCHQFGDQAAAIWIQNLQKQGRNISWFGDTRIWHEPPASREESFRERTEICHTYLSLHGAYPPDVPRYHEIVQNEEPLIQYEIPHMVDRCKENFFDYKAMPSTWYSDLIPCGQNPVWEHGGTSWVGRSDDS